MGGEADRWESFATQSHPQTMKDFVSTGFSRTGTDSSLSSLGDPVVSVMPSDAPSIFTRRFAGHKPAPSMENFDGRNLASRTTTRKTYTRVDPQEQDLAALKDVCSRTGLRSDLSVGPWVSSKAVTDSPKNSSAVGTRSAWRSFFMRPIDAVFDRRARRDTAMSDSPFHV